MPEYKGINRLKERLATKQARIGLRYRYYEMKNDIVDKQTLIPEQYKWMTEVLGWSTKAVDTLANRLVFDEFENDNFDMNTIFEMNNKDVLMDSAILGALISACDFIYISKGEDDYPRLQVIDGHDATGFVDPFTNLLTEGYAVLSRDPITHMVVTEAYFTSEATYVFEQGNLVAEYENPTPYPLLVPIIYRPDATRALGHSRISRACMNIQQSALRTLKRAEVSAEFYSFPQKYALGLDPDVAQTMNSWEATMSSFLRLSKSEDGSNPSLGQFSQQSMTPYIDQIKMFASLFAGETGLTMDDLGFVTDNPSSAESIKASHENLRLLARKAQRDFGTGFLNVGYLAACLRDNFPYLRNQIYLTKPKWQPIFEPDMSTLSLIGDGAIKINQAVPGYFGKKNLKALTGIDADEANTISIAQETTAEEETEV